MKKLKRFIGPVILMGLGASALYTLAQAMMVGVIFMLMGLTAQPNALMLIIQLIAGIIGLVLFIRRV